jgi:membrane-associated phospholipid phosphatase
LIKRISNFVITACCARRFEKKQPGFSLDIGDDASGHRVRTMMNLPSFRHWLAALVACAVLVVACIWCIDLPVARFMHAHAGPNNAIALALNSVLLFIPFSAFVLFACGCAALAGRALPRWAAALRVAGFSLMWAIACNYFLLQPTFGRLEFGWWLAKGLYGFDWFHGHGGTGFPSGHMTITTSFLLVIWFHYVRARIVVAACIAAEAAGVVLLNWHFVSDALGGAFLGATAAIMTTAVFATRNEKP